jgi:alpha-N-acetylglucosaminidase
MMEGLGYNPIVPDYVMDLAWRPDAPPIEEWAHAWVRRRYGTDDARAWVAWKILLATAYRSPAQTGTFVAERPQFYDPKMAYRTEPKLPYDPKLLAAALDTLLSASKELGGSDAYRYDVVNLTRQVLGGLGLPAVQAVEAAYMRKDRAALDSAEARVTGLIADLDTLVGTRPEFLLGPWIESAKGWGTTRAERDLYEWNARNIITLWGTKCTEGQNDDLNLYAYKQWQGMFSGYYLPRWRAFFARLDRSVDEGTAFDRAPFAAEMCVWEQGWSKGHEGYRMAAEGDAIEVARRMAARYRQMLAAH